MNEEKGTISDLETIGLGTAAACYFWYGYHVPAVRKRDAFYVKLEAERAAARE